jgi:acyl carrier protein
MSETIKKVRGILRSEFGLKESELEDEAPIFSAKVLDSLNSLKLLLFLEREFNLKISPFDVSLDEVDSIGEIARTVDRLSI